MIEHKFIGFVCKKVNFKDNDAIFSVISKDKKEAVLFLFVSNKFLGC